MGMLFWRAHVFVLLVFITILTTDNVLGRGIQHRIISGKPAIAGQFPWQAILKKDQDDGLLCGGSIVHPKWVLTAAHCTYGLSSMFLMFGTILLDDATALSMTATNLIIHPDYNAETLSSDVSLIGLPTALQFSNIIQPIPLVSSSQAGNTFLGTTGTIAGFGLVDDEYLDFSQNLLYAQVTIIDNSQCEAVFGEEVVTSATLCAKGASGSNQSICSGDSGGPLIALGSNGKMVQIGINSFVAQDMCSEGYPSGYVRLTSFLSFISQTTGMTLS